MSAHVRRVLRGPAAGWRRLPVPARVGLVYIGVVVLVGIFAPVLVRVDPSEVGLAPVSGPDGQFWFGVDRLGRDVYSRLISGTPRSLVVGIGSAGLALLIGSILGALAATSGRIVDEIIMRVLDVIMAFPTIVLAAILVVAYGNGDLTVLVFAIGFVFMPQMARIVRANVMAQYGEDYVAAEQVLGAGRAHILIAHVVRNCAAPILVFATIMVANAIVFEASLSFIGAGLPGQDAASSWGSVIAFGQQLLSIRGWWATFFAGLLILLTALALTSVAEGISDAFAAPVARDAPAATDATEVADTHDPARGEPTPLPGLAAAAERFAARARPPSEEPPLLSVRDLRIGFADRHDGVDVVDGIDLEVRPGEVLGLVGESGCGKSLTALTMMGLHPRTARVNGAVELAGTDLLRFSPRERRGLLGTEIAMIYQDALSALNPAMTIRAQLKQLVTRGGTRTPAELLELVGLDAERTLRAHPHELSGGQRQRVVIAMALSREPKLIIADEPTTALDVTVQAQVMALLLELRRTLGFALVLVSHDLALISDVSDRIAVMYGGQIVETGTVSQLLQAPAHHYTRGLLGSVLSLESGDERLIQIHGVVPSPADFPAGCRFADRCPMATDRCLTGAPTLAGDPRRHAVACHHPATATNEQELVRS